MAFYSSYKQKKDEKCSSERAPLSQINGNRKLPRPKDAPTNEIKFIHEKITFKPYSTLPFPIFEDDELSSTASMKYERPFQLTSESELSSIAVTKAEQPFAIFVDNEASFCAEKKKEQSSEKPPRSSNKNLFGQDYKNLDIENFPPPPPPLIDADSAPEDEALDYLCSDSPYKDDNFAHLRQMEKKYKINAKYMSQQAEVNSSMRNILIDWLIDVGQQFEFSSEAVHLTVSLIDRFLSCTLVSKDKLQLVGIACLFISAKYEEVNPQELDMYAWITDHAYTKKHILRMEQIIMDRLRFYVGGPTALSFTSIAYSLTRSPEKLLYLGQYLCELALLDNEPFLSFLPSVLGVAAYCLARYILGYITWNVELEITGYTLEDLKPAMNCLFTKAQSMAAKPTGSVSGKYSHPKFWRVAEIKLPEELIICY